MKVGKTILFFAFVFFVGLSCCFCFKAFASDTDDVNKRARIEVLILKAQEHTNVDSARQLYQQALELAMTSTHFGTRLSTLEEVGDFHYQQGEFTEALSCYRQMLAISDSAGEALGIAAANVNMAKIYEFQGLYPLVQVHALNALAIYEEQQDTAGLARTYNTLGNLRSNIGEDSVALVNYRQSYVLFAKIGDRISEANALHNLGHFYKEHGLFDSTLLYYQHALGIFTAAQDTLQMAFEFSAIGAIYLLKEQYEEALNYYEKALEFGVGRSGKRHLFFMYTGLGNVQMAFGQYAPAIRNHQIGLQLAKEIPSEILMKLAYQYLSVAYGANRNYQQAYEMHVKFKAMEDLLQNESAVKQLTRVQMQYDFDQQLKTDSIQRAETERREALSRQNEQERQNLITSGLVLFIIGLLVIAGIIYRNFQQKKKANLIIQEQKHLVEKKNKEVTDSITYAKRIQEAILPPDKMVKAALPESFIYYVPKDIVSGDFYWVESVGKKVLFAVVDCTGHGVPGAMMSVIGYNALYRAIHEFQLQQPAAILDKLNELVEATFEKNETDLQDGMDIGLCAWDPVNRVLEFAGAFNGLYVVGGEGESEGESERGEGRGAGPEVDPPLAEHFGAGTEGSELDPPLAEHFGAGTEGLELDPPLVEHFGAGTEGSEVERLGGGSFGSIPGHSLPGRLRHVKANRQPIGKYVVRKPFVNNVVSVKKGEMLYLYSDGYADQFGGPNNKKFYAYRFRELLVEISHLPVEEQKERLKETFEAWKGKTEQIDDVCVMGVRVG